MQHIKKCFLIISSISIGILNSTLLPNFSSQVSGSCENTVNLFLEEFRKIMKTGSDVFNIPILAPYQTDYMFVNVNHSELGSIIGPITNFTMEKLDTFNVTNVDCKFNYMQLKQTTYINLTIPYVNITGEYNLTGFAMQIIPMYGNGPFSINVTNLQIGLIATAAITNSIKPVITAVNTWMGIESSDVYFYGLLDGGEYEELFNKMFTELGPTFLQDLWPDLEPIIDQLVLNKIQSIFSI